jgi:electron transfer flavoprotein beta subunit
MIAACLKWVDRRPEVDPITGVVHDDTRFAGISDADQAALEWALRHAETTGQELTVVTAGPPQADGVLRDALACGASRAVRVNLTANAPSPTVARALASVVASARVVWCGDYSLDRGSGSVPSFLAAGLGAAQGLGLVAVTLADGAIEGLRRLDKGRRERIRVSDRAVLSVEGSTARLRRAPLSRTLVGRAAPVDVVAGPREVDGRVTTVRSRPYRPRPRVLAAPVGSAHDRIAVLTGFGSTAAGTAVAVRTDPIVLDPAAAAERILSALTAWGYRPEP